MKENFGFVGGKMELKSLTNTLNEKDYAVGKAYAWISMVNDHLKPKKWLKARAAGTSVHFESIKTAEEHADALLELEEYLKSTNEQHGTDLFLHTEKKPEYRRRLKIKAVATFGKLQIFECWEYEGKNRIATKYIDIAPLKEKQIIKTTRQTKKAESFLNTEEGWTFYREQPEPELPV